MRYSRKPKGIYIFLILLFLSVAFAGCSKPVNPSDSKTDSYAAPTIINDITGSVISPSPSPTPKENDIDSNISGRPSVIDITDFPDEPVATATVEPSPAEAVTGVTDAPVSISPTITEVTVDPVNAPSAKPSVTPTVIPVTIPDSDTSPDDSRTLKDTGVYRGDIDFNETSCPLIVLDGLSYVLFSDKTATVTYTIYSDDTKKRYNVPQIIVYKGNEYTVTTIDDDAFYCFTNARRISLADTITAIGDNSFNSCEELNSITLPASLKHIGTSAFASCRSLESIVIPDSVTKMGKSVFYDCTSLKSVVLSKGLLTIPDETFSGCELLTSVTIPEGITGIGTECFWYCESLTSFSIPESVLTISDRAFYDCLSIKTVRFPSKLMSVSDNIFDFCDSMTALYVPAGRLKKYRALFDTYEFDIIGY